MKNYRYWVYKWLSL